VAEDAALGRGETAEGDGGLRGETAGEAELGSVSMLNAADAEAAAAGAGVGSVACLRGMRRPASMGDLNCAV
jgi:hypothetical protein